MINHLKSNRNLIMFMAIPVSVLLSMFALRFLQKGGTKGSSYFGSSEIKIPSRAIEFKQNEKSNLDQAEVEIEKQRHQQRNQQSVEDSKIIPLSFSESTHSKLADPNTNKNYLLPGVLQNGAQTIVRDFSSNRHKESLSHGLNSDKNRFHASRILNAKGQNAYPRIQNSSGFNKQNSSSNNQNNFISSSSSSSSTGISEETSGGKSGATPSGSFNGFSESGGENKNQENKEKTADISIQCVVLGDQNVKEGSKVKFRTAQDFRYKSRFFPRNTIFTGYAVFRNAQILFNVHKLGEGNNAINVNMHCRPDGDSGVPLNQKGSTLRNGINDTKDVAIDEISANIPIGSSVISRAGRSLFHKDRQEISVLNDGQEVEFVLESEN